jgi:gliding motility-associated protein GldE
MRSLTIFIQEKLGKQKTNFSVDQLSQALELTSTEDTTQEEQKLLEGIVSFGNTDTKQVMSPRIDLFALEIEESFAEIFPKVIEKGYSRIPVYRDNIDHIEGVLFVKDLIPHINKKEFDWKTLIREPFFVPENKKLDDLLKDFQRMKSHLAIVVDEYGGSSGIVTMEDIMEEIFGEIQDEFDVDEVFYQKLDENNWVFEGKALLLDVCRWMDLESDTFDEVKGENETLGGLILERSGQLPQNGAEFEIAKFLFKVESVDRRKIKRVKVTRR